MRNSKAVIAVLLIAVVVTGCAEGSAGQAELRTPSAQGTAANPNKAAPGGLVKSFEFLGCSGDWTDEGNVPDVWRTVSESGTYFLVRHADTCGYTIGSKPAAKIQGNSLKLSYELSTPSDALAACPCEFWAKFELARVPSKLESVSINGVEARLKGSLAER